MIKFHAGRVSAVLASALFASACGGSDMNTEPTTFKVRLENVAPFTQLKSGVFNTRVGGTAQDRPRTRRERLAAAWTALVGRLRRRTTSR